MKKYFSAATAVLALAALTTIQSCKKDEDDDKATPSVSKESLLTSDGWVQKSAELAGVDVYALIPDCEKDNIIYFNADKTGTKDEGALKCDDADPQSSDIGTWELMDGKLVTTDDGDVQELTIVTLTSTELVLEVVDENDASASIRQGYSH